ncbi:MAG: hypothetical protein JWO40_777 [Candidatus Doudnabacteria bacterium]|nr:hypothetical protein [Candidatus Doudnabacteria bacterium]
MQGYSNRSSKNLNKPRKNLFIGIAALIIFVGIFAMVHAATKKSIKTVSGSAAEQDSKIFQSQSDYQNSLANADKIPAINGVMTPSALVQRPFAVVIENLPAARPQSGLSQADIVYEALAEGGITRFLAVFQTQQVKSIGPIRSARTYFNDWAQELGAIFAHVGGNSDALYYLKQGIPGLSDADQFVNGAYMTRIPPRLPPHNTYSSTDKLFAMAKHDKFSATKTYSDYIFKDDAALAQPTASKININFSLPAYTVKWLYDSKTNTYKRYNAGVATIDAGNNKSVNAKDLIVQRVRNWPVKSDTLYAISMGTREGGDADVYMDGGVIHGTWKLVDGRTKYFDQTGNEIALNRGQIWIEIVPPANTVTAQ